MRSILMLKGAAALLALSACAPRADVTAGAAAAAAAAAESVALTTFVDAQGRSVGTARLVEVANGVRVEATLGGLPPGTRAIHIHQTGRCEAPGFQSAGGHLNPGGRQHGFRNPQGAHLGDLPNLTVEANGTARFEAVAANATLRAGANALLRPGGTALVIHAGADDYLTDPSGDSGDRIACAVIGGA